MASEVKAKTEIGDKWMDPFAFLQTRLSLHPLHSDRCDTYRYGAINIKLTRVKMKQFDINVG